MARPRKQAPINSGIELPVADPEIPNPDTTVEGGFVTTGIIETDSRLIIDLSGNDGKSKSYVIANQFVDKDNFAKAYNPGEDTPASFTSDRIAALLKLGLIKEK